MPAAPKVPDLQKKAEALITKNIAQTKHMGVMLKGNAQNFYAAGVRDTMKMMQELALEQADGEIEAQLMKELPPAKEAPSEVQT